MSRQHYVKPFVGLVVAVGATLLVFCVHRLQSPQTDIRLLLLFLLMVSLGARLVISIPSIKGEVTVNDSLIFLAMLLCGGEAAILVSASAGFFSSLRVTKKTTVHVFNAAMMACSTFFTVIALRTAFGPIETLAGRGVSAGFVSALCVMGIAQYTANSGLATIYTGCKTNQPFWQTWRKSYLWTSLSYLAGASAAFR